MTVLFRRSIDLALLGVIAFCLYVISGHQAPATHPDQEKVTAVLENGIPGVAGGQAADRQVEAPGR